MNDYDHKTVDPEPRPVAIPDAGPTREECLAKFDGVNWPAAQRPPSVSVFDPRCEVDRAAPDTRPPSRERP